MKVCVVQFNAKDPTGPDSPRQVCATQITVTGMSQSNGSHLLFRQPFIYLFIYLSIYQISNNCGKSFYFEILVRDSRWWVRLRWHNEAPTKEEERFGFRELGFSLVINKKKMGELCLMASHGYPPWLVLHQEQGMSRVIKVNGDLFRSLTVGCDCS